jgi:voltage-gated potassium channel
VSGLFYPRFVGGDVTGPDSLPADADSRDVVRFYLLDHRTLVGKVIDVGLLLLNLVFVGVFVAETYPHSASADAWLWRLEVGIAAVFLVEYVLRVYGAKNRLGEALDPYTVIDLLAIVPTIVVLVSPGGIGIEIGFLRVVRVIRVLRFYRFTRDEEFFFGVVEAETLRAMKLLLTVLVLFFASAGMFYTVESGANGSVDTFGEAFYYVVVTLTTVGFGDIVPVTATGRWITVAAILAGIVLIPWQAGRIVREWANRDRVAVTCENCGLRRHDRDASHCKACGEVIYQEYESGD